MVDFNASSPTDLAPTFLVGGNTATSQPAKAVVGAAGLAVINAATQAAAQTAVGVGLAIANVWSAAQTITPTVAVVTPLLLTSSIANYLEVNVQNTSAAAGSSSDFVVTADNGGASTHYGNFGINGSGGGAAPFTAANAAYFYSSDNELDLAAIGTSGVVNICVGASGTVVASASISAGVTSWAQTTTGNQTSIVNNTSTNTIDEVYVWGHNSTGTPAAGFGTEFKANLGSATVADREAWDMQVSWDTATDATRKSRASYAVYDTARREFLRATTDGSIATTAFFGTMSQVGTAGFTTITAATQDGVKIVGRAGGTSNRVVTIIPTTLASASRTFTLPDVDGTATTGTGTANQLAYWTGTNAVAGSSWFTYASTSGANLLTHAAGTSTATTTSAAFTRSVTFSGAFTTGPVSCVSNTATYSGATVTASLNLTTGYFNTVATGAILNATNPIVSASYHFLNTTPGGATTATYVGTQAQATVTANATANFANSTLIGALVQATFGASVTTSVAVATAVAGQKIIPFIATTNGSGTNTLASVYGTWIAPGTWTGAAANNLTVANYYGLYIDTLALTNITVTNRYGIYQSDAAATNNLVGKLTVVRGTDAATTTSTAASSTVTYSGAFTTGPVSALSSSATYSGATVTASLNLTSGYFNTTSTGAILNATNPIVSSSYHLLTATPGGATTAIYAASQVQATVTGAANVFFANSTLIGDFVTTTFNTSNTTGAAVATAVVGAKIVPSIQTTNASGTNTLANAYGLWVAPGTWVSSGGGGLTVASYYGLYIDTLTLTTMTVTNRYGIYQSDAAARNYFAGPVRIVSAAAPGTPVTGDVWTDSTQNCLVTFNGGATGVKQFGSQTLFSSNATLAFTAIAATTLFTTGTGTTTIPANMFATGKAIRVTLFGNYTVGATASTFTFTIGFGATTFTFTTPSTSGSTNYGRLEVILTCTTAGASGAFMYGAQFIAALSAGGVAPLTASTSGTLSSVNTTGSLALTVNGTWSQNVNAPTFTVSSTVVEVLA